MSAVVAFESQKDPCDPNESGDRTIERFHVSHQKDYDRTEKAEERLLRQN